MKENKAMNSFEMKEIKIKDSIELSDVIISIPTMPGGPTRGMW